MKIWIDARNFSKNEKIFFLEFLKNLKDNNSWDIFNIYWCDLPKINTENINIVPSEKYCNFFAEQTLFLKKLLNDKNDIIFNFDETFPIFYQNKFIKVIFSLKKLFYPDFDNSKLFNKYSFLSTFKNNLKKSNKIICFHNKTKEEINEKLNINEAKIEVIDSFFYKTSKSDSLVNIKSKYLLKWDYIIYNSWIWNSKNLKKFLEAFLDVTKVYNNLNLFIIWNQAAKDIELRENILSLNLTNNVTFIWEINSKELKSYYSQALFLVHPVSYENFALNLSEPLNYNTPILASNLQEISSIFQNEIKYFNPLYKNDISKVILENISKNKKVDYVKILEKYDCKSFVQNLLKTI